MEASEIEKIVTRLSRYYSHSPATIIQLERIGRESALPLLHLELSSKVAAERIARRVRDHLRGINSDRSEELRKLILSYYGPNMVEGLKDEENPIYIAGLIIKTSIEKIGGFSPDDAPILATDEFFKRVGISDLIWAFYQNNRLRAIKDIYPGIHLPWEFGRVPMRFWKGSEGWQNAIFALSWFAEEKGLVSEKDCIQIGEEDFMETGLDGLLQAHFNSSPNLALSTIFPNLKPWQTRGITRGYFQDREHRVEDLTWLLMNLGIGSIGQMTPEEVYDTGIRDFSYKREISKAGMRSLLSPYSGSVYDLFMDIFPEQILPWTLRWVKKPWRKNYMETIGEATRWLFEKYLKIEVGEIPSYATYPFFCNKGFNGHITNRKFGFNSSPFLIVDNAYPGRFSISDFDAFRPIRYI